MAVNCNFVPRARLICLFALASTALAVKPHPYFKVLIPGTPKVDIPYLPLAPVTKWWSSSKLLACASKPQRDAFSRNIVQNNSATAKLSWRRTTCSKGPNSVLNRRFLPLGPLQYFLTCTFRRIACVQVLCGLRTRGKEAARQPFLGLGLCANHRTVFVDQTSQE